MIVYVYIYIYDHWSFNMRLSISGYNMISNHQSYYALGE